MNGATLPRALPGMRRSHPLRALVRGAALCAGLALGAPVVLGPAPARASVFDFMSGVLMSQGMPKVPGDTTGGKPRTVVVNGFPMFIETGRTDKSVHDVLNFYQARYQGGYLKKMTGRPVAVRRDGIDTGTLMSVEVPDNATARQMMDGKRIFASGGPLRMAYAHRVNGATDYMAMWSDKAMPQSLLQPVQSGDAPGQDVPGVPRPLGARTLSFAEPKAGYLLVMYTVNQNPEQALRDTAVRISSAGWHEDVEFGAAAQKRRQQVARFMQGDKDVVVTAKPGKGATLVTYLSRDLSNS